MDRHEHYVTPAVEQFHYLVHAAFVVLHLYQAAKDTHAMVDVHHKIAYVEGAEVVHRELLALFHRPSHAYAVEAVKNLVVRVQANAVLIVDKAAVDVPALHKFRKQGMFFLQHDGAQAFQLAFLLPYYIYLIIFLQPGADVTHKQLEVLVEHRLRGNVELHLLNGLFLERNIQVHVPESAGGRKEVLFLIHIRRIQPDEGIFR